MAAAFMFIRVQQVLSFQVFFAPPKKTEKKLSTCALYRCAVATGGEKSEYLGAVWLG